MQTKTTIGLFGTCGNSQWRKPFIELYDSLNINYFNPVKPNWNPSDAIEEAEHLANDEVVLFPITGETFGIGSLAETGFSVLQAIKLEDKRDFIIMIEPDLIDSVKEENPQLYKESVRARALIIQHLKKLRMSNVYIVDDLDDMLYASTVLYKQAVERRILKEYIERHK